MAEHRVVSWIFKHNKHVSDFVSQPPPKNAPCKFPRSTLKPFKRPLGRTRRLNLRLLLRLHVQLCKRCAWRFSPLNAGSRQQLRAKLLQVLDEFLFLASSSKCLAPKDHAEVNAVTRAVKRLSWSLQSGIGFLRDPLPGLPWASLAVGFPRL